MSPDDANFEHMLLVLAPPDLSSLGKSLANAEVNVVLCPSIDVLCGKIGRGAGAVLASEEALDASALRELQTALARAPAWSDLPLVILASVERQSPAARISDDALNALGNVTFVERPVQFKSLLTAVRSALRARRCQYAVRDLLHDQEQTVERMDLLNQALEKRVVDRTAQLQEINDQMEAFAYSVSHDLRAPLRAIRGFAQALAEDYGEGLDETARDYLNRMGEGAERLDRLIQELLQYSRLGRTMLTFETVDLETAVQRALEQLESDIRGADAAVEVVKPLPKILGHPPTLEQVLINLICNAIKFVAPGVKPRIRIWGVELGPVARLWVGDNGVGIAAAYHQRIFGVFERLHSNESYPGTGIGLAIVAKGVGRMGGAVGVESEPGQGSQFWIELPRPPADG